MVRPPMDTPWGNTKTLRARKLRPGPGTSREAVRKSQRDRLFAAMVASATERGYEATSIADLITVSGVSRTSFYEHFSDKQDCFVATLRALLDKTAGLTAHN